MIPIIRLHYKLDQKLNKLASNQNQAIPVEDKDFVLNEAIIKLIKKKIGHNNIYGIGLDGFRKRYQDLESLIIDYIPVTPTKTTSPLISWSYDLTTIFDLFIPIDIYLTGNRGGCFGRIIWVESIVPHMNVPNHLKSSDECPSFAYQATFAAISSGQLIIYTGDPSGEFNAEQAFISYLRYPKKVCFGDYEDFDGNILPRVDCDLPEHLEDEILDIAVMDIALSTENQMAAEASQVRAKDNE